MKFCLLACSNFFSDTTLVEDFHQNLYDKTEKILKKGLSMNKIGFIGLGKLGLECAEAMASSKNEVHGFDIFARDSDRVIIHQDIKDAVIDKKFIFIACTDTS